MMTKPEKTARRGTYRETLERDRVMNNEEMGEAGLPTEWYPGYASRLSARDE